MSTAHLIASARYEEPLLLCRRLCGWRKAYGSPPFITMGYPPLNAKSFTLTVKLKSKAKTTEGENLMASQVECVDCILSRA